jgi:hypothetical protein
MHTRPNAHEARWTQEARWLFLTHTYAPAGSQQVKKKIDPKVKEVDKVLRVSGIKVV